MLFDVPITDCAVCHCASLLFCARYDPQHGVYHLFYQDHLGIPGGNVVWGHVASRDLM